MLLLLHYQPLLHGRMAEYAPGTVVLGMVPARGPLDEVDIPLPAAHRVLARPWVVGIDVGADVREAGMGTKRIMWRREIPVPY